MPLITADERLARVVAQANLARVEVQRLDELQVRGPSAPMVLHAQVCGRVGRRPIKLKKLQSKDWGFLRLTMVRLGV
jgi:hypothetical protein